MFELMSTTASVNSKEKRSELLVFYMWAVREMRKSDDDRVWGDTPYGLKDLMARALRGQCTSCGDGLSLRCDRVGRGLCILCGGWRPE